ncbi:MAG: PIG-L family deacetylase [Candidatus Nanoarchaeia archaeon]|nr:PIG-L family deacetylase [Candidatus Nanoarchaeia archaeon]MDD5239705.1 PIG-L family deacetylase [Candidatus Nanoarchaeia archaeon]
MTTLVFAAHADDEVIGAGGTIAKLAETEKVIVVIFSYGADFWGQLTSWPPMMNPQELIKARVAESQKAGDMLGVSETIFLGIDPSRGINDEQKKKITDIIKKYNPKRIFYHSIKDGHPDHRAVTRAMNEIVSKLAKKPEVLKYQINLFDVSSKDPSWIYDISDKYKLKLKALRQFKSQKLWTAPLKPLILLKGVVFGKRSNCKFAEYFYSE